MNALSFGGGASLSDLATSVTASVALIALCVAVFQIRQSSRIHRAQTRPYIVPEVVLHQTSRGKDALYLQLTNFGKTPARNVTMKFPSSAKWCLVKTGTHPLQAGKPPISLIAPGASVTYFLGQTDGAAEFLSTYATGFDVALSYVDAPGAKPFADTYPLRWDTTYVRKGD